MKIYRGKRFNSYQVVEVMSCDGSVRDLDPEPSQAIQNHSHEGFNWGYNGSRPAQLALAILLHVTGDVAIASQHYQDFKAACVCHFPDTWELSSEAVRTWLLARCVDVESDASDDGES